MINKKGVAHVAVIVLIVFVIIALASFSYTRITGNPIIGPSNCEDSDDQPSTAFPSQESFFIKGETKGTYKTLEDKCLKIEQKLREFYCFEDKDGKLIVDSWIEVCKKGCIDGTCIR